MSRHSQLRLLGVGFVAALAVLLPASAASAHAELVSSTPADGSFVTTAPTEVVLTFDEDIQTHFDSVVVNGPKGSRVGTGSPHISGKTLTQRLGTLAAQGRYSIAYRVVSADGHPVTGQLSFFLSRDGSSPPAAATAEKSGSIGTLAFVTIAVMAALIVAGVVVVLRRIRVQD
jgi:methionine-rich copper-binding protein CopC